MKTKEQIWEWLGKQPWKDEFYAEAFINRLDTVTSYNEDFIVRAFCWAFAKSGTDVWAKRNADFRSWFDSNDKPTSWEEYCKQNPIKEGECYIDDVCNILDATTSLVLTRDAAMDANVMSKGLCEAFLAYMKLIQLRNAWVKDCGAENFYYKIVAKDDIILKNSCDYFMYGLSFPTVSMADDFMDTFEDLLEIAKPLL